GDPRAADCWSGSEINPRRDADSAQRMPSAEAEESVNGTVYRSGLPALPPRGDEAVPQRGTLLHGEVRDREAQLPPGTAREDAEGEARRLRVAAAREAEGQAHLRRARRSVPRLFRRSGTHAWDHGRDAAPVAGTPVGQRDLPARARDVAAAGAAAGASRALPGERQEGRHPVVLGPSRRRDHRHQPIAEEPDDRARDGRSERARHPGMVVVRPERDHRSRQLDADARTDQSARSGAADRRVVLEVSRVRSDSAPSVGPQPFTDLWREAGGSRTGLEARLPARWRKEAQHVERFSASEASRSRARYPQRSV